MVTRYVIIKYKCADCDHWCVRWYDRIRSSTGQGHPTKGISRWFPPPSSVMLVSKVNLLQMIYWCVIWNVKLSRMVVWVLWGIYRCIMLKVICHQCLYEHCEGSIIVLYIVINCYEFLWVLQGIYYCIVLNINCHEWLNEQYEGSTVVLY